MLNMHNEMWGMLMNVYLPGDAAQAQLQAEVKQNPASLKKMEWCQQWTNSKASFGLRLLAFAAVQVILPAAPAATPDGIGANKNLHRISSRIRFSGFQSCSS